MKDMHTEAASMLHDAHDLIVKVGWVKGTEKRHDGAICLQRALREVDGVKHGAAADAEARRIVLNLTGTKSIPEYNDRASTTKDDVLTVLKAAEYIARDLAQ